jgi:hypothetical protein
MYSTVQKIRLFEPDKCVLLAVNSNCFPSVLVNIVLDQIVFLKRLRIKSLFYRNILSTRGQKFLHACISAAS